VTPKFKNAYYIAEQSKALKMKGGARYDSNSILDMAHNLSYYPDSHSNYILPASWNKVRFYFGWIRAMCGFVRIIKCNNVQKFIPAFLPDFFIPRCPIKVKINITQQVHCDFSFLN
jgi:hypothetical protein